jgi:hypothetical protein
MNYLSTAATVTILSSCLALAQAPTEQSPGQPNAPVHQQEGKGPRRPPKEAMEACKEKTAGAACSFKNREGETMTGTCFTPDSSKPLGCKPTQGPQRPLGPQEDAD